MNKVVVITGASKGIGKACAIEFSSNGYKVYDLSRSGVTDDIMTHIDCDVSDYNQVSIAVEQIIEIEERIDVAISNAGFGISGSIEATPYEMIKRQIDVNFTGAAYFAKAVTKHIRESKGRILFMSSVAADIPIPFQSIYSSTKSAILSLAMALDNEIKPSGARSIALLPGDLSTNFTASRIKNVDEPDFYKKRVEDSVNKMEEDELSGATPELIARRLYKLATYNNSKVKSSVGFVYKFALVISLILPVRFKNWIIGKMYA